VQVRWNTIAFAGWLPFRPVDFGMAFGRTLVIFSHGGREGECDFEDSEGTILIKERALGL
jgi:hypothetical protein